MIETNIDHALLSCIVTGDTAGNLPLLPLQITDVMVFFEVHS